MSERGPWPTSGVLLEQGTPSASRVLARFPDGVRPGDVIYRAGEVVEVDGVARTVAGDAVVSEDGRLLVEFVPEWVCSPVRQGDVIQFDESVGGRNQFSALFSELTGEGRADDAR